MVTNIYEIIEKEEDYIGEDNIQYEQSLSSTEQSSSFQNAFSFHPITTNNINYNFNDNIISSSNINNQHFYQQSSSQSSIPTSSQSSSILSSSSSTTAIATTAEPLYQSSRGRGSHLLKPSWM